MEDYTYHFDPEGMRVLGAHMLEVCPSIAADKPYLEVHQLSIGGKADPARLVFKTATGNAINVSVIDLGNRFRMIVNKVEVVECPDMPNLPVASVLWKPMPDLKTGAAAWILAGGAHHTGFSTAIDEEYIEDFAGMIGIELLLIDEKCDLASFKREIRWNEAYLSYLRRDQIILRPDYFLNIFGLLYEALFRHSKHLVAVDCIIFGYDILEKEIKLLLIKRSFEPAKGKWSLAGGFVKENESLDEAASRILRKLTGLRGVYMEQSYSYGGVNRDPGARVISVAYCTLIKIQDIDRDLKEQNGAHWQSISRLPHLIFDHCQMVERSLWELQMQIKVKPVGFELLA